jgi:hypothetical protein
LVKLTLEEYTDCFAQLRHRATRIQNDQDQIFEGLPIRNWRRSQTHILPPTEEQILGPLAWPELPMPPDSHLLTDMSRHMLRMNRAPSLLNTYEQPEDEEKEHGAEKPTKKETRKESREDSPDDSRGFTVKKWVLMPKGYEASDGEFLAKRRKGLPPLHAAYGVSVPLDQSKTYRTLKVRRADNSGVEHVYKVMAEVGQAVQGEILEEDMAVAALVDPPAAPGTIIEGVGVVNSDGVVIAHPTPKRKPVPPRRKKKGGPGRSKKKIIPELGADGVPIVPPDAAIAASGSDAIGSTTVDTEMPDAAGGEDEEEDSGEEGDEMDEDDEREDGEISATPTPTKGQLQDAQPPTAQSSKDDSLAHTLLTAPHLVGGHVDMSPEAGMKTASDTVLNTGSSSKVLFVPTSASGSAISDLVSSEVSNGKSSSPGLDAVVVPSSVEVSKMPSAQPIIPTAMAESPVLPAASAPLPMMEADARLSPTEKDIAPDLTTPPALLPERRGSKPGEEPGEEPAASPLPPQAPPMVAATRPGAEGPAST